MWLTGLLTLVFIEYSQFHTPSDASASFEMYIRKKAISCVSVAKENMHV
jgi:hypothetical protein